MAEIRHRNPAYKGRSANVDFANGKAETDNLGSIAYFRRRSDTFAVDGKHDWADESPVDEPSADESPADESPAEKPKRGKNK